MTEPGPSRAAHWPTIYLIVDTCLFVVTASIRTIVILCVLSYGFIMYGFINVTSNLFSRL